MDAITLTISPTPFILNPSYCPPCECHFVLTDCLLDGNPGAFLVLFINTFICFSGLLLFIGIFLLLTKRLYLLKKIKLYLVILLISLMIPIVLIR